MSVAPRSTLEARQDAPDVSAPITPQEAERVWKSQARPSARSVARALTHAGRPVHFTTVARWERQGLLTRTQSVELEGSPEDPFAELPPPVTPPEAKHLWDEQRRPSARSVAKALARAGRPVHFTTVARWKKRDWRVEARLEHPLAAAMRKVDLAVPLLTRDPTTKAVDIVGDIVGARTGNRQGMAEDQGLHPIIRESCITLIILVRFLRLTLMAYKLPEIAVFILAISRAYVAVVKAIVQLQALPKDAVR